MLKNNIRKLIETIGVSGNEKNVSMVAKEIIETLLSNVEIDEFYNVVGYRKCEIENPIKILLDAHIDQVGFIVTDITNEGCIRLSSFGIDQRNLIGNEVVVLTTNKEMLRGVIASSPPHIIDPDEFKKSIPINDLILDIGLTAEQVKNKIRIGDFASFSNQVIEAQNGTMIGTPLDNRVGFACIVDVLKLLEHERLKSELIVCGSTKHETGFHGIKNVASRENPQFAIVVDACHTQTAITPKHITPKFGKGPVISIGYNSFPQLAKKAMRISENNKIPYQIRADGYVIESNAFEIQVQNNGIQTVVISYPLKYKHSPVEMINVDDINNTSKLIAELIKEIGGVVS